MKAAANRLVIDASITAAWFFRDELSADADSVLTLLETDWQAVVPAIWAFEVANVFLLAEGKGRVSLVQVKASCQRIEKLPIVMEPIEMRTAFAEITETARQQHLTAYDAAYLQLALRDGLALASLDNRLRRAAETVGVRVLP
jgi:predicted nucleic acid-binding protein